MRSIFHLLLAGLILACPLLCEGAECGPACPEEAATRCEHPPEAPAPCSDDGGSCICRGAIANPELRAPDQQPAQPSPVTPLDFSLMAHGSWALALHHLTQGGRPAGLAGIGDSTAVRALLQNFRC